jgi:hypothetical protein
MTVNFSKGIVLLPTAGLGNRFRIMACAYALSKFIEKPLYIQWTPANDCTINLSKLCSGPFQEVDRDFLTGKKYLFFGNVHTEQFIDNALADPKHSNQDYLVITGGHDFKPKEMPLDFFFKHKSKFYRELVLSKEVSQILNRYRYRFPKEYIAIHYRDIIPKYDSADINNPKFNGKEYNPVNFTYNSPLESFETYINCLDPYLPIYVSSNTSRCITYLRKIFPNRNFFISGVDISHVSRESETDIINSFVEFILLSRARLIIGTYFSSFSDEPSFFNLIPKITPINNDLVSSKNTTTQAMIHNYHCYGFEQLDINKKPIYGINLGLTISEYISHNS